MPKPQYPPHPATIKKPDRGYGQGDVTNPKPPAKEGGSRKRRSRRRRASKRRRTHRRR